jgi:uncharacterized C2H2 Zn-finger protein
MYFYFFCQRTRKQFCQHSNGTFGFTNAQAKRKNQKSHFFSNALLKIKVDKIWKLEKQYLLLTKFVNRDLRWKQ